MLNMLKDLKENMNIERNGGYKKSQMELLEMKTTISKMKIILYELNSMLDTTKRNLRKLEDGNRNYPNWSTEKMKERKGRDFCF